MLTLAQDGKLIEILLGLGVHALLAGNKFPPVGSEHEVVHDGLVRKQTPPFRHQHHATSNDTVCGLGRELLAVQLDAAAHRAEYACKSLEAGALACTVAADQRNELAFPHAQTNAAQGFDRAVAHMQVADLQHGGVTRLAFGHDRHPAGASSKSSAPRYASITRGFAWIWDGVPSASFSP